MNQNELQPQEQSETGVPVDLTEQEFLDFSMTVAKKMGVLRTQIPMLILFGVYLVIDLVSFVREYLQTGTISLYLLSIALITLVCAGLSVGIMPRRIKKAAKASYVSGSQTGYYGELFVTSYAVMKNIGTETVSVPLDEHSIYLEDKGFMAFIAQGQQRTIVLPARCITPDTAKCIREAVFSEKARLQRRVFARMESKASEPIARRELSGTPTSLYTVDFSYNEKEIAKLHMDVAMAQYFRSLPTVSAMSVMAGLLMAILQEQLWWFPCLSLGIIFGYLLLTALTANARGKKMGEMPNRTHLTLTDRGIDVKMSPNGQHVTCGWQGVERAVERADCVEFFHGGGHLLRVPKRAIEDFEEFRRVVDDHIKAGKK